MHSPLDALPTRADDDDDEGDDDEKLDKFTNCAITEKSNIIKMLQ